MLIQAQQPFNVPEGTTRELHFAVTNSDGDKLPPSVLDELRLWHYAIHGDHRIINGREGQDVLGVGKAGQNDVVLSAEGDGVWYMQPEDTALAFNCGDESHEVFFQFKWTPTDNGRTRTHSVVIRLFVIDRVKVG